MIGGQDKKKADNKSTGLTRSSGGLTGTKTGLTGASSEPESSSKSYTRPSFKKPLAKYEKQGAIQKKKKQSGEAKDVRSSSKLQGQPVCCAHQNNYVAANYGLVTSWFNPYFYTPLDYSRMHMQSYYIQYPFMYPNHTSPQRSIVASNNLVKKDIDGLEINMNALVG